ncbi:MAG: hypothetical protein ACYS7Y_16700 [Planctomycetota bacterium]|jgi:hypothetical protein
MGLFISIPVSVQGDDGKYYQEDIDVIIHKKNGGEDSLEIVDFDMDAAVAAEALGMDDYDIELGLYRQYKTEGLNRYIRDIPSLLEDAFEEQGYDVFTDETFSRDDFLNTVGQNIRDNTGSISRNIEFIKDAVNDKKYDKDEFIEDLIEGLKTLVDTDRFVQPEEKLVPYFLHPLVQMLPEEAFVFHKNDPFYEHDDVDLSGMELGYEIIINDESITSWSRIFYIMIQDPIWFTMDIQEKDYDIDGVSAHALAIMDYMGWEYPPFPDDHEEPEHPESDYEGLFGVQYLKRIYPPLGIKDSFQEKDTVPYKTMSEAEQAAELSLQLFELRGQENDYMIKILQREDIGSDWFYI